jgi:primosomal protein N' (replication factor Y)
VQTYLPEHPAIASAAGHDYDGFVRSELGARRELGYPPFGRLVALRVDGRDAELVRAVAEELARVARAVAATAVAVPGAPAFTVLGPAEAPIARIRGRARWQLLLRGTDRRLLRAAASRAVAALGARTQVRVTIDVDPMSTL